MSYAYGIRKLEVWEQICGLSESLKYKKSKTANVREHTVLTTYEKPSLLSKEKMVSLFSVSPKQHLLQKSCSSSVCMRHGNGLYKILSRRWCFLFSSKSEAFPVFSVNLVLVICIYGRQGELCLFGVSFKRVIAILTSKTDFRAPPWLKWMSVIKTTPLCAVACRPFGAGYTRATSAGVRRRQVSHHLWSKFVHVQPVTGCTNCAKSKQPHNFHHSPSN